MSGGSNRLWIVNQYATQPERGGQCRHHMIAQELVKAGLDVTIFAASGHHLHQKPPGTIEVKHGECVDKVNYVWIATPSARQSQLVRRVISWFIFSVRLVFNAWRLPGPGTILHSSPSLLPFVASWLLAKRHKSKVLFEFRDIWPESLWKIAGQNRFHPLILFQSGIERFALRTSDHCLSTLPLGSKRLEECGRPARDFTWLPNGQSDKNASSAIDLPAALKSTFESDAFILVYTGSMGRANSLDQVVDCAALVANLPVRFVLFGDGNQRAALEEKAAFLRLNNIRFHERVSKDVVKAIHANADALFIVWQDIDLYRYGTSPNKIPEYFAAGRPVIQAYSGAADAVAQAQAGITVDAENPQALAGAVRKFLSLSTKQRSRMGANGRRYAADHYAFSAIAEKLRSVIQQLHTS